MSFPHFDLVQRAYDELRNEGKIQQRSDQEQVEADKGLLTQRSGWYVNQERSAAIGVLEKLEGNNYLGYSVDLLIQTDGTFWDICTDSGGLVSPVNGGPSSDPALIPRWRQPSKELAQLPDEPAPVPPDVQDIEDIYEQLTALQTQQADDTAAILARDDANTQRILDTIDSIKTQVEESLQKALVIYLRRRNTEDDEAEGVV